MKRKITINPEARVAYIPKELIDQGLKGELDGYANAITLTIVKPEASLEDVENSLLIVLEDIRFRKKLERKNKSGRKSSRKSKKSIGVEKNCSGEG